MHASNVTYGQLDKVLRSLGFSRQTFERDGDGVRYEHKPTGALIVLPLFADKDPVLDYHLAMVRTTLDGFGVAAPSVLDAKLNRAS